MQGFAYGFRNRLSARFANIPGGPLIGLLAAELTTLYYALIAPFRSSEVPAPALPISMHRDGYMTAFVVIMCIGALELVGMHLLLTYFFEDYIAWIVTALSVYGMLFLIADFAALVKRPAMLRDGVLYLYVGIRWAGEYPLGSILNVAAATYATEEPKALDLSLMNSANIRIDFREEQSIRGLFGIRKRFSTILLTVDEADRVLKQLSGSFWPTTVRSDSCRLPNYSASGSQISLRRKNHRLNGEL